MPQQHEMGAVSGTNASGEVALANTFAFKAASDEISAYENRGRLRVPPSVLEIKECQQVSEPIIQLKKNRVSCSTTRP
ncbi:hypothetical protein [Streptomyces sp. NPDC059262]|uniref:hypothetical protein n=1 Tax=Streptomyces sp. NPDC059262 TaxID=3346797 RepID=UPI0036957E99